MNKTNIIMPQGFESLEPREFTGFENSGDVYWHKFGRASIDFAALKDTREEQTHFLTKRPDRPWYRAIADDPRFHDIQWFEDPTGRLIPPGRNGHPDFIQAFPGYPEIPVEGQGDELGEPFTEAADTIVLRRNEGAIEVLLIQRDSGYFGLPGGVRTHVGDGPAYEIDGDGIYRQLQAAQESAVDCARRTLRTKAGIDLPAGAFSTTVYWGIVDDIRNSRGAAMYSTVFGIVDDPHTIKPPGHVPGGRIVRFVPLEELLRNQSEPSLSGLWGSHTYCLKRALWAAYVTNPDRFGSLSSDERESLRGVLAYDPLDHLLDDEVAYAAQNHWASGQWSRRVPWPVRGPILSPLDGGRVIPGMEDKQGHLGLVPAWIMKKARRLPSYAIDDLISDLELHRDNHTDIPTNVDFSYLKVLRLEDPGRVAQWMQYLGGEAIEANRVWVQSALTVLDRLGIDKKQLGALRSGESMLEALLELKRQMIAVEGARSIAELIQMLSENDEACDFMVRAHTAWREHAYRKTLKPGSLTSDPHRPGERHDVITKRVRQLGDELWNEFSSLIDRKTTLKEGEFPRAISQALNARVTATREELEASVRVSGAQSFYLMLHIGRLLEDLAGQGHLPAAFREALHNQLGDLLYVVKMDANSAVISGILNAARKQGARLKFLIETD